MDTAFKIVKMIALLSVAFVCSAAGYEVLQLHPVVAQASSTLAKAGVAIDAIHATTLKVDLTVGRLDQTMRELQYPILQAGLTSKKEADMLDGWNAQITHTLNDVDAAVVTANQSTAAVSAESVMALGQLKATLENVNPSLNETAAALRDSQTVLLDADRVIADPNIVKTLANTQTASQHVSDTAGDVQGAVHSYLHPGWKTRVFNWSMTVVHALGGWF